MRREEKRRKFNEAIINTLYPPPPSPSPSPAQSEDDDVSFNILSNANADILQDDYGEIGCSSTSDDDGKNDGGECGIQKLTRAQRKRLRKKKLKEDVSRRCGVIGPLLPPLSCKDCGGEDSGSLTVRRNADEEPRASIDHQELSTSTKQSKVKHRRTVKKLTKNNMVDSEKEKCHGDQSLNASSEGKCDQDQKSLRTKLNA